MNEKERIDVLRNYLIKKLNSLLKRLSYKKEEKDIIELFDKQKGKYNEKISKIIEGLKKPKYTKSLLDELKKQGYTFEFEYGKYYIIYDQNEPRMEMPKDIRELFEQLGLFEQIVSLDEETDITKAIIENIMVQMVNYSHNDEIGKKELEEISETIQVEPYSIIVDANGAIRLDVNGESSYLPIRFSRKMLSLGALPKEQELMKQINDSNDSLGKQINVVNASHSLSDVFKLFEELKTFNDNSRISFIDGRYYIEDSEAGTSVELSLEQNNTITELENSIFNRIRDSYEKPDNNTKNIDFRSYDALLKLIELGFKLERDETSNKIIITSVTGREFTKEQSDFIDLDFSDLPFIQEKSDSKTKSTRSILKKEDFERGLKLAKELDAKVAELIQELNDTSEKTSEEKKRIEEKFIEEAFLDSNSPIKIIDGRYYIAGNGIHIPLTVKQRESISKLEEELFNTIYNAEKDSDADGKKSVVQDVNGYNTLIQMMELGYNFYINTDKDDNIEQDEVIIISPTKKEIRRDVSDFGDIKTGELPWTDQKGEKASSTLIMEKVEQYKELAEYINNVIYPAIEAAEKNLDHNSDTFQKELSLKYLLNYLNPNDRDKSTSYINGRYVIASKKNEIAIGLSEELSAKLDRLTKEYVAILYKHNITITKDIPNYDKKSKEDIIEDIRSYFSNRGIKIEDIENKISPVFDENGERISIDINAQKTIIQLMELGYRFAVEEGTITITSPCGNTFDGSADRFKQKGLPYTQSMFGLIEEFAKKSKDKDYSTTNFYDFLMSKASIENKARILQSIRADKRFKVAESTRLLKEFTREQIVKKIKDIQELRENNEDYIEQLIEFYKELKSYSDIAIKYNREKDVYVVYDYETKAWCTLPDEQCQILKVFGGELTRHVLERKENKYGIETAQLAGMIQLLELGFVVKPIQNEEGFDMYIFDPFDTNTGEDIRSDKDENNIDYIIIDENCINHYKELLKIAECVNEKLKFYFEKMGEDANYKDIPDFLRNISELENVEGESFFIDWFDYGNSKELCFVNPKSKQCIPLTDEQSRVLIEIKKKFQNEDLYKKIEEKITGKTINKTEDELDTGNHIIIPDNTTEKDRIINSFKMYKVLREWGLDITAYEGGISRVGIEFPWNETISLNPKSIPLLTENPINLDAINHTSDDYEELKMLNYLFEQGGLKDKFELFDEYFEVYSSNGKPDESIINFLIESAIIYYKREHPFESIKKHTSNVAFRAKQVITDPKILLQVPESIGTAIHAIKGNNTTAMNIPLNSISIGLPMNEDVAKLSMNVDDIESLDNGDTIESKDKVDTADSSEIHYAETIDYTLLKAKLIEQLEKLTKPEESTSELTEEGVGIDD